MCWCRVAEPWLENQEEISGVAGALLEVLRFSAAPDEVRPRLPMSILLACPWFLPARAEAFPIAFCTLHHCLITISQHLKEKMHGSGQHGKNTDQSSSGNQMTPMMGE